MDGGVNVAVDAGMLTRMQNGGETEGRSRYLSAQLVGIYGLQGKDQK